MKKQWILKTADEENVRSLSASLSVSPAFARVLISRGLNTPESAKNFLDNSGDVFLSPFLLNDMDIAVDIIFKSLAKGEKILVFGDYDVDGVTATSVLYSYLTSLGGEISYYIPSRHKEGYGLSLSAAETFVKDGTALLITTDTGVTAHKETAYLKENGVSVIVTDHHTCVDILPPADAVVNPMRPDNVYPFKGLAGVGVAFKLMTALEMKRTGQSVTQASKTLLQKYGDLIAIGTVGDVMPLTNENRAIVTHGLARLENTENIGLKALLDVIAEESSGASQRKINAGYISYVLAPRLNAVGRIADASMAVNLLTTESSLNAMSIAGKLCDINFTRKNLENQIYEEAIQYIEQEIDLETTQFLVLANDHWHHGIIGIVASRIAEKYHRSCILISFRNEADGSVTDIGKGSGRSVGNLNLVEALSAASDILIKYGGHKSAAGLSLSRDRLSTLTEHLNQFASGVSQEETVGLSVDTYLLPHEITTDLAKEIAALQPYGTENPPPLFLLRDYTLTSVTPLSGGKHTRLHLALPNGGNIPLLCFGLATAECLFCAGDRLDVVATCELNLFQNRQSVQLTLTDMRISEDFCADQETDFSAADSILKTETHNPPLEDVPLDHELPSIYMYIKEAVSTTGAETRLSISAASADITRQYGFSCSRLKLLLALNIFRECSLLTLNCSSCDQPVSIRLLPRKEQKVPLASSRLYVRLRHYYKSQTK